MVNGMKEKNAGGRAIARSVRSVAELATKANDKRRAGASAALAPARAAALAAAVADVAAARKRREETAANMAAARAAVASAAVETMNLKPESYSDSGYWEQRHAKSREGDETYDWYTGYPDEALREVIPSVTTTHDVVSPLCAVDLSRAQQIFFLGMLRCCVDTKTTFLRHAAREFFS